MSLISSLANEQSQNNLPQTYSDLIKKVGSHGRYQTVLFFIFSFQWFITGFYDLSAGFMYMNRQFGCSAKGLLIQNCFQAVCSLKQQKWQQFILPIQVNSLATQFGPFYCSQQQTLSVIKTINFVGAVIGVFIFAFLSDNFGRRKSLIIAQTVVCFGLVLICISQNIYMASIGFLLVGGGNKGILRITGVVFSQVSQSRESQRKNILVQLSYGLGGCFVGIMFYFFNSWRIVTEITTLPNFIVLYLLIFYLKETPEFLLRKNLNKAVKQLNIIGKINLKRDNILTQLDLQNVISFQGSSSKSFKTYTIIDLFKFKSLRLLSFWAPITSLSIIFLYLAPIYIISSFGFNTYLTQIVLCSSQMVAVWLTSLKINKILRVKTCKILFLLTVVFNGLVFFIDKPQECTYCIQGILQLGLIFFQRFCITIVFALFVLHMIQAFPQSIRGTGSSFTSAIGNLSSIFGPILLELIRQRGFNQMIVFPIVSAIGVISVSFLPETLNKPLQIQIQQIAEQKQKLKQKQII